MRSKRCVVQNQGITLIVVNYVLHVARDMASGN